MLAARSNPLLQFLHKLEAGKRKASLPDRDLLQSFITRRDEAAFAALVQRHGPMVLRVCSQVLHDEQNAEDAFQATFLVLSRKAASVRRQDSLASWLYGVAHHAATDLKRSLARRRTRENHRRPRFDDDPLEALSAREAQAILHQELCLLPEKYRAPLVLCCLEGFARDEAARQLAWPLGKLKSRLEQARKVLGARLVRRGLTLSGALAVAALYETAALRAGLVKVTLNAAASVATRGASSSAISAKVALLTQGVMKAMLLSKLKSVMAIALVFSLVAIGAGVQFVPRAIALAGADNSDTPPSELTRAVTVEQKRDESKPGEKISFTFGQVVLARFFLRNAGKATLEVGYPRLISHHYYRSLRCLDMDGKPVPIRDKKDVGFPVGWLGLRLAGGDGYAETAGGSLSIGGGADQDSVDTVLQARPGQAYSVQYTLPNYGDRNAADLQTGEFRFRVLEKNDTAQKPPIAGELKKQIAWGKPGKNGLQVGVLLAPVKAAQENDAKK